MGESGCFCFLFAVLTDNPVEQEASKLLRTCCRSQAVQTFSRFFEPDLQDTTTLSPLQMPGGKLGLIPVALSDACVAV